MVSASRDRKALDDVSRRVDSVVNEHLSWGIICLKLKIKNWLLMNLMILTVDLPFVINSIARLSDSHAIRISFGTSNRTVHHS